MLQPKDTDWLNGYKNKTHIYVVNKKPVSDLKTHIDWKWEDGKIHSLHNGKQKKVRVSIFISDKESDMAERLNWTDVPNIGAPQYIKQTLTDIKG